MRNRMRLSIYAMLILLCGGRSLPAEADAGNDVEEARKQYTQAIQQADAEAASRRHPVTTQFDMILHKAVLNAAQAKDTDALREIDSLGRPLHIQSESFPPAESIKSPDLRQAFLDYQSSIKTISENQSAQKAATCRQYITKLDQLRKRAMRADDLVVANQINSLKMAAEMELKIGVGRFPGNPIALFTFDKETVTKGEKRLILDQSGHGNDILLEPGVTFVPGRSGTALHLSHDRNLHSRQPVEIAGRQPRTLSFWLKVDAVPDGELHSLISWGATANGGKFGAMISHGHYVVWGWGTGFDWETPAAVEPKVWHHHAIVYNGSETHWYIDGKPIGADRQPFDTVPAPLAIGGVDGDLQEVAIYARALTGEEVNQLFHRPSAPAAEVIAGQASPTTQAVADGRPTQTVPPAPVVAEIVDLPIKGEFFSLVGQAGLPQYLKCDQPVVGGSSGLRWGTVRTAATDYIEKDFILDVVFALTPGDPRRDASVGIGSADDRANPLICHLGTDNATGHVQIAGKHLADLKPDVPHLLRFEKKGDVLTVSVTSDFKGKYRADASTTIPSIKGAARDLIRLNANLWFGGNALFKSIRLEVDGAVVDPGPTLARFVEPPAGAGWTRLGPGAALPSYLDGSSGVSFGKDGMDLTDKTVRTKTSDYLNKDFTIDVVYAFNPEDRHEMRFGIGENGYDGGNWIVNSVTALLHGPPADGHIGYTFHNFYDAPSLGNMGKDHPGPNFFRFQKRGDTLLMAASADYRDRYEPDFQVILPALKWQAPYLNGKNSGIFFGGGGTIQRIRMLVDGKTVGGDESPAGASDKPANQPASNIPATRPGTMVALAGTAGVPSFMHASPETLADGKGLVGGEIHTATTDLIEHDFVFDVLFDPSAGARNFYVALGQEDSIQFRITDAGKDGGLAINIPRHDWVGMGKVGATPGPHLLRVEKRGNTLTFSLSADYKGNLAPEFVRTIPDVKSAAPSLTRLNSAIHVHGDGWIQSVGLSVDGVDQNKAAASSVPAGATTRELVSAPNVPPPIAPALSDMGPTGGENFIKLTGPKLPGYFETQHGLKYASDGLPLKDVHIRTRDGDLVDKNFTFDIVFHFTAGRETLMVGLGADEREGNWNHKSIVCRVESPPGGGYARIVTDHAGDTTIGSFGNNLGPHLLRLLKRGNTLTFALCINYKGTFKADFIKTLPDIKAAQPLLDATNSRIFIGDGSVAEQTRLIIEGQSIESHEIALEIPAKVIEGKMIHETILKKMPDATVILDESAPKGMHLSPQGTLTWIPGHDQVGLHDFKIKITSKEQTLIESAAIEVVSTEDAATVGGDLAKVDSLYRLPIEGDKARLVAGLGGDSLLLLDGQSLRQLGGNGISIVHEWKLPGTYQFIAERQAYFVAMSDETKSLDLIDKTTMKITKSVQMDYFRRLDLCLNPIHPISYVSVAKASGRGGFDPAILIVDERTGDVREPRHFAGTFLQASLDGTRLYAGYKDIYTRGHDLLFNPEHIDVVPVYGNIDIIVVYDVTDPNRPVEIAAKNEAGGNGQGLALSRDGKRLSYLSHAGYPIYSDNIAAWDPTDLTKRPVSYPAKANHADCRKLAFHPLIPIAAAPSETGAACFDRESGQLQPDRLNLRTPLSGTTVHDVIFSPDGKYLILHCERQGDFFLLRVKLNLSADEMATIKAGPPPVVLPVPAHEGEPPLRT